MGVTLCADHLNRSVGLITCERRLFGETAKSPVGVGPVLKEKDGKRSEC